MNKNIIISFTITITLLIFLGAVSIMKMMELSELTQKLYKHPFAVTNATKTIETNLVSMHRYMKDVALANSMDEIKKAVMKVNENEIVIYKEFDIVFDRYLGDRKDIQVSYDAFVNWKPIRDEVIDLMKIGKSDEAAQITKGKGAKHVADLNKQVGKMVDYASNKAIFFKENALKSERESITLVLSLLALILIIVITVLVLLVRGVTRSERKLKEHLHLIDQNIMSASSDKNFKLLEVSNALSLHFSLSKTELLATGDNFLISDCSEELQDEIKRTLESGHEWHGEISKLNSKNRLQWFEAYITPQFDSEYKVIGHTNILNDISSKKKIEEISRVDGLTNLYNRRFFDETFSKVIKIAHRQERLLAFVMIDIDHFKAYNDTYGHQDGDKALKKVASHLKSSLKRPDDYSFRLGGEEFGMLYMVKDAEDAMKIVEKTRAGVEALRIAHSKNSASEFLTISMGVCIVEPEDNSTEEEIYAKSDEALYEAKESGRNRVVKA
ncbi:MAG: diguanylate cyclase [Campylobacterota bacterium]|nr:diguanylate cyclase [Campylobacterota bacterium]